MIAGLARTFLLCVSIWRLVVRRIGGGGNTAAPHKRSINRGLAALDRAEQIKPDPDPYTLQAAIAACHARAFRSEETDWPRLVELYDQLAVKTPSPIVELNRAVALSMADGPEAGLALVDRVRDTGTLDKYHLFHSVRGDLLDKLGRHVEAVTEFERAAGLAQNSRERQLSTDRAGASRHRALIGSASNPTDA